MNIAYILKILTIISGVALSLAYYPQVYRILKTKSAKDISIPSYILFATGTTVYTIYGFYFRDLVIISGFLLGFIGSWSVLLLAIRYRNQ